MPTFHRPTILMCPPDFYGIEYSINPWMDPARGADRELSMQQWSQLRDKLAATGVELRLMEPVSGLPDLVFTANAGLVWQDLVFVATFRHGARQGETPIDRDWFLNQGFEVCLPPEPFDLEGAGDALFCGETLFGGYLIRSDASALQWVAAQIGCRVIPLQLVDPYFYHLDTCFCPLNESTALYFPGAFDEYGLRALHESVPHLIEVNPSEAARFACNAVVVGRTVVLNSGCPDMEQQLAENGFTPVATDLSEFLKSGGSAKCLTLRLDGEEAAVWPPRPS